MTKFKKTEQILLSGGEIINPENGNRQKNDLIIINGKIDSIGNFDKKSFSGDVIDATGTLIMPGLIDMHVHLREPGREDEETIESGCEAAMAGGMTAVCAMPNTDPPCDKQQTVKYLINRAKNELVDVLPIAAITKKRAGQEITEMAELVKAGAVGFSDDGSPVQNTDVMRRALEYAAMYDSVIIDHCEDPYLFKGGHMNEGIMSTRLGVPPIPSIGEEIMIGRNIHLAKYTGGRIHIAHISTKDGVELVRRAKNEGVNITCEVTPHHLVLTDEALVNYDTNLKMNPPLRTAEDVEALKQGLSDGTIDVIASDHAPHSIEEKDVEFIAAPFGIIGLETMLGLIQTFIVDKGILSLEQALNKMSLAPRKILNLDMPKIEKGAKANTTVIYPDKEWTVNAKTLKSLSKNTPFDNWNLKGRVKCVINNGLYYAT